MKRVSFMISLVILISLVSFVGSAATRRIEVWLPAYEGDMCKSIVMPEFEKEYPDIKVLLQVVPWAELEEKIMIATAGGVLPDVSILGEEQTALLINLKIGEPLGEYLKQDGLSEKDFFFGALRQGRWNEELHLLPLWVDFEAWYWRKDLGDEAGYAQPPKNWDELLEYAEKLTIDKNSDGKIDQYLMNITYTGTWLGGVVDPWIWCNGGEAYSRDLAQVSINERPAVEAFQFYIDLGGKYQVALPPHLSAPYGIEEFINGTVVMNGVGPWAKGAIRDKTPPEFEKNWTIGLPLRHKRWVNGVGGGAFFFPLKKNIEAAWTFGMFFASSIPLFKTMGNLPAYLPLLQEGFFQADEKNKVYLDALSLISEGELEVRYAPAVPELSEIQEAISKMVQEVAFENTDTQKAADECQKTLEKLLAPYKLVPYKR